MTDFFEKMNQGYAQKHFPSGSVLEDAMKTTKRRSVAGILFLLPFFIGALYGLVWSVGRTMELMSEGQDDMLDVSIVICAFFGLAALGILAAIWLAMKQGGKKRGAYLADSAKHSKLPVSEIEGFERQALAPDCYILRLTKGLDRALSNATSKDGLLTRDYVYLADPAQTVIRTDSLRACCLSDYTYYITIGKRHKKVHCLAVYLLASNGVSVLSDTTEKAGQALIAILQERNRAIDTNGGRVLSESERDDYQKKMLGGR